MKKVFFACMTVGLLATSCDWFKTKPTTPIVETPEDGGDSTITINDNNVKKPDTSVAVVEQKTETKKEVKK